MAKVSVIVPIYGVERYIARCAESLMRQSLWDVEFIFVDDATSDKSMCILQKILAKYSERESQVKILTHGSNKGLSSARNTGLAAATGKYVFHCDSDDYVDADMLEVLYNAAEKNLADIVWCDWYLTFGRSERYMSQPSCDTPFEAIKAMLGGRMKYNVWNKLVKRSLYVDYGIVFPDGYSMGEDMTMILLFTYANQIYYIPKAFYHYVKANANAFSQTYSDRHLEELRHNVLLTTNFIRKKYGNLLERELAFMKLEAKFPFLISDGSNGRYRIWSSWYPEANPYIMQNKNTSMRRRLLQWCAWKKQFWIVWLYYQIVNRLIYGIIYK